MKQQVYIIYPAIFVPVVLAVCDVFIAARQSWWFLIALPFIWLGSVSAQPNLNLVNGCPAYLTILLGFVVMPLHKEIGFSILMGTVSGFYLSAIEKRIRARPMSESPETPPKQ